MSEYYKTLRRTIVVLLQTCHEFFQKKKKREENGEHTNSFCKASVFLIPKSDKDNIEELLTNKLL